jgi:hypothetical protein
LTDAVRALLFGGGALAATFAWLAVRTSRIEPSSSDRLIAELRLAQFAALILVLVASVYVGFAIASTEPSGTGWDVALAIGFLVLASMVTTWDPRPALTALAVAYAAHAGVDLLHAADVLPAAMVPPWYATACAIYDVAVAGLCYLPILRR